MNNLHPIFERLVSRAEKESRLGQRGHVVWLFGLSGSGKSTIAAALERRLHNEGRLTQVLDGDNLRVGLNQGLGFSDEDRHENIRRASEVANLFARAGVITIVSVITPRRALRELVRRTIVADDLTLVYTKASFETCARRDPKGLYAKVAAGEVKQFTGKDAGFDEPTADEGVLVLDTEALSVTECVDVLAKTLPRRPPD